MLPNVIIVINLLLWGDEENSYQTNASIFTAVQKYLDSTKRFE